MPHNTEFDNNILNTTLKALVTKEKTDKMQFMKDKKKKKLCVESHYPQSKKATPFCGENICKS